LPAFHAIILGIIQGLTEFIPVSSSGHLIAVPALLGWSYQGKSFDAAVHLGTLAALLIYYRRDWARIISGFVGHIVRKTPYAKEDEAGGRLFVPILVACIPAAIVGLAFERIIEETLSRWQFVALALVVFGLLMLAADRTGKRCREIGQMGYRDYLVIGLAQTIALLPGVSRSGITITAGLFRGLDRASSARFSFLLSTPVVFGAGVFALRSMLAEGMGASEWSAFAWGFVSAMASGYLAIHFLMTYLQKRSLTVFVVYRICLAAALVGVFVLR
jgi:undecaprenyl-diphosphatase